MKLPKINNCVLLAGLTILLFSGCKDKKDKKSQESVKLPIEVANPVVKDIILTQEYPGYLQSEQVVNLVARVSGTITQINYKPGQRVRKGDLLFVIEPQTYIDEVEQAQASLREGQANLAYLKANYERTKEAIKANAVSQIQLIEAQAN